MARKRKGLGKKLRFQVFHRDGFTCQYCGRRPPQVVLQPDHVLAHSKGGSDTLDNLITSCEDCNQGKGDADLAAAPESLKDRIARQKETAEQVAAYNAFLMEQRQKEEEAIDRLGIYWCNKTHGPRQQNKYTFGEARAASVKRFLQDLPEAEVLEAIDIANARYPLAPGVDDLRTWRYFCGVCWRKIKGDG